MQITPNSTSNLNIERNIWKNCIIDKLIDIPKKCPLCGYSNVNITEYNSLNNPYIATCYKANCRKIIYLREGTIFAHFPKTACSNILYVIKLWLLENKNTMEIHKNLKTISPI